MNDFDKAFDKLVEEQQNTARGLRLEMLQKDLSGTRKMLEVTAWPVLRSLEGFVLEMEVVSSSGVRLFVDAFKTASSLAMESEGFVPHAQNITRDRFTFERRKVRTIASHGYIYAPFSRDELDHRPDECRSSFAELIGKYEGYGIERTYSELNVYEREIVRYARLLHRPFRPADAKFCLGCGDDFAVKILKNLMEKRLLAPVEQGLQRIHKYKLEAKAYRYLL